MDHLRAPETLVIEMLLKKEREIGKGPESETIIREYFKKMTDGVLLANPVENPSVILCPEYGQSGWAAFTNQNNEPGAAHLYVWDSETDRNGTYHPPFITIDITGEHIGEPEIDQALIQQASEFFGASKVVHKWSSKPGNPEWENLAPHVVRQRLEIVGNIKGEIGPQRAEKFLLDLTPELNMRTDSSPISHDRNGIIHAWHHWTTSGTRVVIDRNTAKLVSQTYTCRGFPPGTAINFTLNAFPEIENFTARNF